MADTLITATTLRDAFFLPPSGELKDSIVTAAIERASRKVVKSVGQIVYDDATNISPVDVSRSKNLADAESYQAMAELTKAVGMRIRRDGFTKKEVSGESRGMDGNTNHEFMSPKELSVLIDQYESDAENILVDYPPEEDPAIVSGINWMQRG